MYLSKETYLEVLKDLKEIYDGKDAIDRGSVEWGYRWHQRSNTHYMSLNIAGTNEPLDWLHNFNIFSYDGVKISSYASAWYIYNGTWGDIELLRKILINIRDMWRKIKNFGRWIIRKPKVNYDRSKPVKFMDVYGNKDSNLPVVISCHSKSGPTGIYFREKFLKDNIKSYCIAFCPARGSRGYNPYLPNVRLVIDPDDIVPIVGWSVFNQFNAPTINLPDDKSILNFVGAIKDHLLSNVGNKLALMNENIFY